MVGPAVGVSPDSRTPRRSCRSCPVHSSLSTPDGLWSHIADTLAPVAGVTVLDDEPPRVGGVPEGLRQCIGNDTLLGHTAPPCWMVAYGCDVRNTLITPYLCGRCQRMAILGTVGWRVASPSLPAARQAEAAGAAGARGC